jgi:hypothetical protein
MICIYVKRSLTQLRRLLELINYLSIIESFLGVYTLSIHYTMFVSSLAETSKEGEGYIIKQNNV